MISLMMKSFERFMPWLGLAALVRWLLTMMHVEGPGLLVAWTAMVAGLLACVVQRSRKEPGLWMLCGFFGLFCLLFLAICVFGVIHDMLGPSAALLWRRDMIEFWAMQLLLVWTTSYLAVAARENWRVTGGAMPVVPQWEWQRLLKRMKW